MILDPYMILIKDLPYMLQLLSKYSKYHIVKGFIYILKQINASWITLVKITPYILLLIIIVYDLITYKGTIKHIYMALLFFFIYRTWHNLAYFFYRSKYHPIDALCFYYYKLADLADETIYEEHKSYWNTLQHKYCEYAANDKTTQLSLYLYCNLDMERVEVLHFNSDPHRDASDLGKWFVKQKERLLSSTVIMYLYRKITKMLKVYLVKKTKEY
jgi:hypothetical protein